MKLLDFLFGIVGNVVASAAYDALPRFCRWLLTRVALQLPEARRDEAIEQWTRDCEDIRENFRKLWFVLSLWSGFQVESVRQWRDARAARLVPGKAKGPRRMRTLVRSRIAKLHAELNESAATSFTS